MFKKIMIANRGEIVNRITRTCNALDVKNVIVYADADQATAYSAENAERIHIGPSVPSKSYLNIDALIQALKSSGADAVHPGYGFLSESAPFAMAVKAAGAKWIGPSPQVMESIESKSYCRKVAKDAGVPISPGTTHPVADVTEVYEVIREIGLPVLLKLDKGGGGKGIETISENHSDAEIKLLYESMSRIGTMAFSSGDIYVEKKILSPHHIEVQFIADDYGNIVCLGERECSIQRRYQKIVEESPSGSVSQADRETLYNYTREIVAKIGYSGAGTVEYLMDGAGNYYFMEINARLQVEHPVSEMVTGIDIVEWQIRIANGEELSFCQEDIRLTGHAIECRIYAEDPVTHIPSPGTISRLVFPAQTDCNIRIEHALAEGSIVSPYYDPMLCKVISWGEDRTASIDLMLQSLLAMIVEGVSTSIETNLDILNDTLFKSGTFTTDFLAERKSTES
ncbi:MAG: ATP-grasp domain-containing protein [Clostridiales Family XIII bacterium]|jgi:acetyl/propionyl-CoA carboxylase alpha subunit|nr:ATP-grasp domain-containing protein [Clostridiales Family XIII bacterium]